MFLAFRLCHLMISLTACLINDLEYDLESPKLYIFISPMKKGIITRTHSFTC